MPFHHRREHESFRQIDSAPGNPSISRIGRQPRHPAGLKQRGVEPAEQRHEVVQLAARRCSDIADKHLLLVVPRLPERHLQLAIVTGTVAPDCEGAVPARDIERREVCRVPPGKSDLRVEPRPNLPFELHRHRPCVREPKPIDHRPLRDFVESPRRFVEASIESRGVPGKRRHGKRDAADESPDAGLDHRRP